MSTTLPISSPSRHLLCRPLLPLLCVLVGCAGDAPTMRAEDAGTTDAAVSDAGERRDSATPLDGSAPEDGGDDAGASVDGGAPAIVDLPRVDADGQPIDVGLLVLGHSTSNQGDWPGKLADAFHDDASDGRSYVVFRAITGGDGGFLWSQLSFETDDPQYARVHGSSPSQWCQDARGTRWSCRRLRLERGLTGEDPAPPPCAAATSACVAPRIATCVWHDSDGRHQETNALFSDCWARMDARIALVQDTSNRSFPVDDADDDGDVDELDYFRAPRAEARPCPGRTGTVRGSLDWNCDGELSPADAAHLRYAEWLRRLSSDLLDGFGDAGVDHVFLSHKPVEMGRCGLFPGETCGPHATRTPSPHRPYDRFYLPTVYWEHRALEALFEDPSLDPRVHPATPEDLLHMWNRSAQCYAVGLDAGDWSIPVTAGRPTSIASDDSEVDGSDADDVGCMVGDHIHHNDAGGWLMADVWYEGLRGYF